MERIYFLLIIWMDLQIRKGRSRKNSYLPGKTVPVYENIAWRSDTDSWRNVYRTAKWIL